MENKKDKKLFLLEPTNPKNVEHEILEEQSSEGKNNKEKMLLKYKACMVLHSVGDTIGFGEGHTEFNEFKENITYSYTDEMVFAFIWSGGINNLFIDKWYASDDTVLHLATAIGLVKGISKKGFSVESYGLALMKEYVACMNNLSPDRYPGKMTMTSLKMLANGTDWNEIPYAIPGTGDGNGATIRASCIGLAFHKETDLDKLIAISIESARLTHNSVIGYVGALNISFFISLAIRGVNYSKWPNMFIELLESTKIDEFLEKSGRGIKEFRRGKNYCIDIWKKYCISRFIGKNFRYAAFMIYPAYRNKYYADNFGLPRDTINNTFYVAGKGALDCVIIAYDAFVDAMLSEMNQSWEKLIIYSAIHSGDSDSTGAVAGSIWGAYNGFDGVPKSNYSKLEYLEELNEIGEKLFNTYI